MFHSDLIFGDRLSTESRWAMRHTCCLMLIAMSMVLGLGQRLGAIAAAQTNQDSRGQSGIQPRLDPLSRYLQDLELDGLLVEHLERRVNREPDRERRVALARQLAARYTTKLLTLTSEEESVHQWQKKASRLLQLYPSLESPMLRVAIFHARYLAIERDFREWHSAGMQTESRGKLDERFKEVIDDLAALERVTSKRFQSLLGAQQARPSAETSASLSEAESVLLHSHYLSGWANYFRAVTNGLQLKEGIEQADQQFRSFLQIAPEKDLATVDEEWFEFDSVWASRILIGLAMTQRALGNDAQSEHCFKLVRAHGSVNKDLLPVWRLRSFLYIDQLDQARAEVDSFIKNHSRYSLRAKIRYWVTLVDAGSFVQKRWSDDRAEQGRYFLLYGMVGLATDLQAPLLRKMVNEKKIEIQAGDFLTSWIAGYLEFDLARETDDGEMLASAESKLEQALELASVSADPRYLARCQYLLAWIHFKNKEFEQAAAEFQQVIGRLQKSGAEQSVGGQDTSLAANAMWLNIQSLTEISRRDPRQRTATFSAMDRLVRDFPDSPLTERVEFERVKLTLGTLPTSEAQRKLAQFSKDDPNYPLAVYEKVRVQYRVLQERKKSGTEKEINAEFERLLELEKMHRGLNDATIDRKRSATLLVLDADLKREPGVESVSDELLGAAVATMGQASASAKKEIRYYEFRTAQKYARKSSAIFHARWLSENAQDTRFEQAALIYLIKQMESESTNAASTAELTKWVERLVAIVGSDREDIRRSSNSRAALIKLARLKTASGQYGGANDIYDRLLTVFPKQQSYLREAAMVKMELNSVNQASKIWRKIIAGVEPGSEIWFESKYKLILCLTRSKDPDVRRTAFELYQQTVALAGNMPANWSGQFEELGEKLKSNR